MEPKVYGAHPLSPTLSPPTSEGGVLIPKSHRSPVSNSCCRPCTVMCLVSGMHSSCKCAGDGYLFPYEYGRGIMSCRNHLRGDDLVTARAVTPPASSSERSLDRGKAPRLTGPGAVTPGTCLVPARIPPFLASLERRPLRTLNPRGQPIRTSPRNSAIESRVIGGSGIEHDDGGEAWRE